MSSLFLFTEKAHAVSDKVQFGPRSPHLLTMLPLSPSPLFSLNSAGRNFPCWNPFCWVRSCSNSQWHLSSWLPLTFEFVAKPAEINLGHLALCEEATRRHHSSVFCFACFLNPPSPLQQEKRQENCGRMEIWVPAFGPIGRGRSDDSAH